MPIYPQNLPTESVFIFGLPAADIWTEGRQRPEQGDIQKLAAFFFFFY